MYLAAQNKDIKCTLELSVDPQCITVCHLVVVVVAAAAAAAAVVVVMSPSSSGNGPIWEGRCPKETRNSNKCE